MSKLRAFPPPRPLGPNDLRAAAQAFETALDGFDENTCTIQGYAARHELARFIIDGIRRGERESARPSVGALEHLRRIGSEGFSNEVSSSALAVGQPNADRPRTR